MCGIAGFNLSPSENVDALALSRHLLLEIERRGRHATGVAFRDETTGSEPVVIKEAVTASDFVQNMWIPATARNVICHTRFTTQGSELINANNHPVDVNGIVGVHNGMIWNDDDLFDLIGSDLRIAQVDSEAIFASLLHRADGTKRVLESVEGSAAIAWMNTAEAADVLNLSRIASSPLEFGFTEQGSFVFASTYEAMMSAAAEVGMFVTDSYSMKEGHFMQIQSGRITRSYDFENWEASWGLTPQERQALDLA